jgi:cytochrome c oxidase subunit 2
MVGEIRVLAPRDYEAWLDGEEGNTRGSTSLAEVGRRAATDHACFACHTVDGQPHIGPTWNRLYGSTVELANGQRVKADAAYLTRSMMEPTADIVAGYPAVMPTYLGSLPQPEAAAIVEYIRSLANAPVAPRIALPALHVEGGTGASPAVSGAPPPAVSGAPPPAVSGAPPPAATTAAPSTPAPAMREERP